jgi:hypothetical protein
MGLDMEPVSVVATIGGADIIDDHCNRIADKLSHSGDLRSTDAYRTYSGKIDIR